MASKGLKIEGPAYKNEAWIVENFLVSLTEDHTDEEIRELGEKSLFELAKLYTDRFSDFCVLEGIKVDFPKEV